MIRKGQISKKLVYGILEVLFVAIVLSCGLQFLSINASNTISAGKYQAAASGASLSGYRAVCYDGTAYIAVGTSGRIDRISPDKTVTRLPSATTATLNGVVSMNGTNVAVGDGGALFCAKSGGNFKPVKSGTTKSLYSVAIFQGAFWVSGADGILLSSSDGEHWKSMKSGSKNKILSITANEKMCMAITRESQIFISVDGKKWRTIDYNKFYKGYSEPCLFRSIRACGDTFFITGEYQNHPDTPAILSSEDGELWREHVLNEINSKPSEESYPLFANAIAVNWDQLVAACNGGKLLTVTECSECNKLDTLCKQNINDLAAANGFLALVGDGFWFDIRKSDTFRQYSIAARQALEDCNNGACIIDVRTDDEYTQKHITGCMHIPVDKLETELEKEIPDKSRELIFYCQKGVRAQKALEKALILGYKKVYNLGGIGDWPYDTETGGLTGEK